MAVTAEKLGDSIVTKKIVLNNIDEYINATVDFKAKIADLVDAQVISEQTGNRIILDHEYGFFVQMVGIEYK